MADDKNFELLNMQVMALQQSVSKLNLSNWTDSGDDWGKLIPDLIGGVSGIATDYCYAGKTKVTIPTPRTTWFLEITMGETPSAAWVAAMPETQDENKVVFDIRVNRIYIHGAFAGES